MDKEKAENKIYETYYKDSPVDMYVDSGDKDEVDTIFYLTLDSSNEIGMLFDYYGSRGKLKQRLKNEYEQLTSNRDNYEIVAVNTKDAWFINKSKKNKKFGNKLGQQYLVDLSMIPAKTTSL